MFPSLTPDPRLLAIEDDPTLGAHLFQHLNGSGFEVTWCRDGEEGLAAARSGAYDLILMDIMLPGRDGLEILRQLRQEQALPVILMSALGAEQDRIAGFSQGADDYLPKPFSRWTASSVWNWAPTTTWPSPATRANSPHGCAPCCGEPTRRNPARRCNWVTCR